MKRHAALILMLGTLSLVACKKKDGDAPAPTKDNSTAPATKEAPVPTPPPAGSGSAPAAATPPPAAGGGGGGCADGAYKDPAGVYCVKPPEGYKPPKATQKDGTKLSDQFETDDGFNFTIEVWESSNSIKFENFKKDYGADSNGSKITGSGDYDGGNGFWSTGKNDAQKELSTESVIKVGTKVVTCQAVTAADKPMKPADACKTLHAL